MSEFINTKKEIAWGDWYFRNHVLADDFNYRVHKKELSSYYQKRGFSVSMMYDDYFSRFNGIHSEQYMSVDLYYFYAMPCLNRHDFKDAYSDKNLYPRLFPGMRQPICLVRNMNGMFFDAENHVIGREDAAGLLLREGDDCIIKPTVETCNGDGVAGFRNEDKQSILGQFASYKENFVIQRKLHSCRELQQLNPTSLNSCRICTYRDLSGVVHHVPENTFLRIGGPNAVKDNMSSGGGACCVYADGRVDDRVCRYKSMTMGSLSADYGAKDFVVPNFGQAVDYAKSLHDYLPYFDFIGWDIVICDDMKPSFIEFNVLPGVEAMQTTSGVVFGKWIDEVMDRVSYVRKEKKLFSVSHFRPGFDYRLAII